MRYLNSSPQPVFVCDFELTFPTWQAATAIVRDHATRRRIRELNVAVQPLVVKGEPELPTALVVSFPDNGGRRWRRGADGTLERVE